MSFDRRASVRSLPRSSDPRIAANDRRINFSGVRHIGPPEQTAALNHRSTVKFVRSIAIAANGRTAARIEDALFGKACN